MATFGMNEAEVEHAVLDWLGGLGWQVPHSPGGDSGAVRENYGQVVLVLLSMAPRYWASGAEQKCTTREVIGQRKCPRELFERSVTEAGWQQAGRVS